ncbi:MAG: FUSC family protein, partial [Streptosporangiaceae bacterium]
MKLPRLAIADPGLSSLRIAARAAIVMPAVFAVASQLIRQPQTEAFAAFGAFAMLVLTDFSGPPVSRFTAYLSLALTGAVLVVAGTLCSANPWLAAAAMAVAGFVILFSGVINGYFAAGGTAAILAFVLSVAVPVPASAIPWRLAGWGLAAAAALCAVMLMWPPRQTETLRADAARAAAALADLADAAFSADQQAIARLRDAAQGEVSGLRRRLDATSHRPTGPAAQAAALAALVDELGWLLDSLLAVTGPPGAEPCRAENGQAMAAAAAVLRASGRQLTGLDAQPQLGRLEQAQAATVRALVQRASVLAAAPDDQELESQLQRTFRIRAITFTTAQIAGYARTASGLGPRPPVWQALRQFAAEHLSGRSVWLRNSIRGAAGLAVAVFIAQRTGLQHSFWVVLGTLSVLRSNALGTSRSVVSALAGTAAGIVLGAAIVLVLGASDPVLWGVLPVAVLVAAYAPRAVSFAAGQAAFTVVLVVLFNIIQPTGWKVGLIRIEDVAIGFAVSLGVGLVFWPRGAAAVLRRDLAEAYSRGAAYVMVAADSLIGIAGPAEPSLAGQAATAAVHQLDDAFRQYLAERSAKRASPESAARLVAGPARLLRAGRSLASLDQLMAGSEHDGSPGTPGESLDGQVQALRSWYVTLGDSIVHGMAPPPPQQPDPEARGQLLQHLRGSLASGEGPALNQALAVLWASQHLDILRRLEAHLGEQAVSGPGLPLRG